MTNREIMEALSDRKLARLLVRWGLGCQHCPARDDCTSGSFRPCEERMEAWLREEYAGARASE